MATAVPVLPLLAAGVLDATAARLRAWTRRVVPGMGRRRARRRRRGAVFWRSDSRHSRRASTSAPTPTWTAGPPDHPGASRRRSACRRACDDDRPAVASDQLRLGTAPRAEVHRGGVPSPGSVLPLALPPTHRLAFVLYPDQSAYLPFLREIYPGGSVRHYTHPTEGRVVSVYRVPRSRVERRLGSLATTADGATSRVPRLGALPSDTPAGTRLRWSALLSVPRYWNYRLRLGPGPARLRLDGKTVLSVAAGQRASTVTLALARGRHLVTLDGLAGAHGGPKLEWRGASTADAPAPDDFERWRPVGMHELSPAIAGRGLFATVASAGLEVQRRLDGTIASCCLSTGITKDDTPFVAVWRGTLRAPRSGTYRMALDTQGPATLSIDGRTVLTSRRSGDDTTAGRSISVRARTRSCCATGLPARPAPWNGGGRRRASARASCLRRRSRPRSVPVSAGRSRPRSLRCSPWTRHWSCAADNGPRPCQPSASRRRPRRSSPVVSASVGRNANSELLGVGRRKADGTTDVGRCGGVQ